MIKINPYPYVFAFAALTGLYVAHKTIVAIEVDKAVAVVTVKMKSEYQGKLLMAAAEADRKEKLLETYHIDLETIKDKQIETINTKLSVAVSELRKRPKRPSPEDNPQTTSPPEACTGTTLYSEDGEFLIREAARADQIIIERDFYYTEYENARKVLNEIAH